MSIFTAIVHRDDDIHDFIIKKTVTGNQGNKNKEFSFTVTIDGDDTDKAGKEKYKAVKTPKTGDPEIMHITDEEAATFTLMDGETLHIYGLSENDEYTVTEADYSTEGYTTSVKDENAKGKLTSDDVVVEFIKDKNVGPATGSCNDICSLRSLSSSSRRSGRSGSGQEETRG